MCEAFDSRPKHVAVNRGPVDPTEGRAGSYSIASCTSRDISSLANLLARRRAVSMPADTPAPVRYRPSSTQRSATYLAPSRSRNPRYAQ
jgi:hypothetical protein